MFERAARKGFTLAHAYIFVRAVIKMSSSPFSPNTDLQCLPVQQSRTSKIVNGQYVYYDWCLKRNAVMYPSSTKTCAEQMRSSGSIMSIGGGYDTGVYTIRSQYGGASKYYSSTEPPYCTNVNVGDKITWSAKSYTFSNKLCFSSTKCPSTTTTKTTSSSWWIGKFFD